MAKAVKTTKKPAKKAVKSTPKNKQIKIDFAVVKVAGTQLLVKNGVTYTVNRVAQEKGAKILVDQVLLVSLNGEPKVGNPYVKGAVVEFEVVSHKKDKKLRVFKYKAKSRYRKTIGHRAHLSKLLVRKIQVS